MTAMDEARVHIRALIDTIEQLARKLGMSAMGNPQVAAAQSFLDKHAEKVGEEAGAVDPTAMTQPLTVGQRIVADWDNDMIAEPCELAAAIDAELTCLRAEISKLRRTVRMEALEEAAAYIDHVSAHDHSECGHGDGYMDGRSDASACVRALKDLTSRKVGP